MFKNSKNSEFRFENNQWKEHYLNIDKLTLCVLQIITQYNILMSSTLQLYLNITKHYKKERSYDL